jgi:hypothetical protein
MAREKERAHEEMQKAKDRARMAEEAAKSAAEEAAKLVADHEAKERQRFADMQPEFYSSKRTWFDADDMADNNDDDDDDDDDREEEEEEEEEGNNSAPDNVCTHYYSFIHFNLSIIRLF